MVSKIEPLETKVSRLQTRVDLLEKLVVSTGKQWRSPGDAAEVLGVSRRRIMALINLAEQQAALGEPETTGLVYGTHYRLLNEEAIGNGKRWKVNVLQDAHLWSKVVG